MDKARRKEIANQYTHTHRAMGAYRIVHAASGKSLVGTSLNLEGVWNKHKFMLDIGQHTNKELTADWKQYGEEAFHYEILEQIKPEEEYVLNVSELAKYRKRLPELEQKWMDQLAPYGESGYHKLKQDSESLK